MEAVRVAEAALGYAAFDQQGAQVWSDVVRSEFASALADLSARLLADPSDRSTFSTFESIGPSEADSDSSLMEAIIELDLRIGNLEFAESTLFELATHLADLEEVLSSNGETSAFASLTSQIFDAADRITEKLLSGGYLTETDVAHWNEPLSQVAALVRTGGPRKARRSTGRWLTGLSFVDADITAIADKDTQQSSRAEGADEPGTDSQGDAVALLEELDADLASQFLTLGPGELRHVALLLARGAVTKSSLRDPRLAVLEDVDSEGVFGDSPERHRLEELVDELSEGELRLEEAVRRGKARPAASTAAYRQARAATAAWYALSPDPVEAAAQATCHAAHAVRESDEVLRFARQILRDLGR